MKLALAVCCACILSDAHIYVSDNVSITGDTSHVDCTSVCNGQDWGSILSRWGCRSIQKQDCFTYGDHPECGTNGVTYRNRCDYSKAHCGDNNIHVAYIGSCSSTTVPPTGSPGGGQVGTGPVISGPDAVFDFFCLQLSHIPCENDLETICGSDGATYVNSCEFEKQRCTHRELTITKFGKC